MARIAILLSDRCHPKECQWECQAYCPPVRMGQECIVEGPNGKPIISETLCIGCGICVHKCPFDAIKILNTPEADETEIVHRYGYNGFRLYRLPLPPRTGITGLLGPNGTGKSTALRVLAGTEVPNLGHFEAPGQWAAVLERYRGTQLHDHFRRIERGQLSVASKPQYVDWISEEPVTATEYVGASGADPRPILTEVGLETKADRRLAELSGGELQLVSIARTLSTPADLYLFDEPSSYLDIVHRLAIARLLRRLGESKSVVVVEHDLALLDYLADTAHLVYGEEAAFGVISHPLPMRTAINTYLTGYLKDENVRFRTEPVQFVAHPPKLSHRGSPLVTFGALSKRYEGFHLTVEPGELSKGETVGIVGPNATGKTTFVKMLAGVEPPTEGATPAGVKVSYKPQYLKATSSASLRERLEVLRADPTFDASLFERDLVPGLRLDGLLDVALTDLSGGELQRAAVALALAHPATLYLLDEPSAYLDADERMAVAKLIRRQIERQAATALVVDHDVYFLDLASDALMVFGHPGGDHAVGAGAGPFAMREGMNRLLREVEVTFRRDAETLRPRINREGSVLDREQRAKGEYYYEAAG
ncbi:MAG: ribosome biogenesis/translation initiation ATPase RLI [Thermoplasmata archaeon]|nr:ribosome biogenesis/translation initiation ATPase RLI [Thermoplasmata archaeon]MCI4358874.1 ribosome biogenesis/translation initiation ATPase RLI [Thermoplasmata archaeon]